MCTYLTVNKKEEKTKINFFRFLEREIDKKWFYRRGQVHRPIRITRMMSQTIQKRQVRNQGKNTQFFFREF